MSILRFSKTNGFTLVELAIVMMIIGLLIGGILKGQEMLKNAAITATIKQISSYDGAMAAFMDKYGSQPGDMAMARARIPGCTDATNCQNGNGNSIIGTPVIPWNGSASGMATENTQFWKHLALSDFISGINPSYPGVAWGESHPAARLGGGFTAVYGSITNDVASMDGFQIRLQNCLVCGNVETDGGSLGTQPVSPSEAAKIDRKMDDGMPFSGFVRASVWGGNNGCEGTYDETITVKSCVMYFKL